MSKHERTLVKALAHQVGNDVTVKGWVHRIRKLKTVAFIVLRDRSGMVQCVCKPSLLEGVHLGNESVVSISGHVVVQDERCEIDVEHIELLSAVHEELPIQVNLEALDVQLDTLLNHRVLGLRHPKENAIFKIQAALSQGFSTFLRQHDFLDMHSPKLVKEGAEGGANVFSLDYFGEKAYLAQSPQFYKQMAVIAGYERVFEVGPVFRAETHRTRRHLNEYVSLDLEMAFIQDEYDLMAFETQMLGFMLEWVLGTCPNELSVLEVSLPAVPKEIPVMKLEEAILILKQLNHECDGDLDPEGERLISAYIYEHTGSEFLFLTHYPISKRPMYTKPLNDLETQSFDLLFRGLEITTGGMRIHQYEQLLDSMIKKGYDPNQFTSYLEAFKHGVPPHGGLAIGLERLTAQLLGISNIRRTSLFPRDSERLTP